MKKLMQILLAAILAFSIAYINDYPVYAQVTDARDSEIFSKAKDVKPLNAEADENIIEKAQDSVSSITEEIVDKLNLNEPLPDSTKKFFKQIQGEAPIENTTHP